MMHLSSIYTWVREWALNGFTSLGGVQKYTNKNSLCTILELHATFLAVLQAHQLVGHEEINS